VALLHSCLPQLIGIRLLGKVAYIGEAFSGYIHNITDSLVRCVTCIQQETLCCNAIQCTLCVLSFKLTYIESDAYCYIASLVSTLTFSDCASTCKEMVQALTFHIDP